MATATKPTVVWDEADSVTRTKRPWYEIYPAACEYVDFYIDSFMQHYGKEADGYSRKATGFSIPLDRDSEHENTRAVRLVNDRCKIRKLKCHAALKNGNVHFVIGHRVVKKRVRKPKTESAE